MNSIQIREKEICTTQPGLWTMLTRFRERGKSLSVCWSRGGEESSEVCESIIAMQRHPKKFYALGKTIMKKKKKMKLSQRVLSQSGCFRDLPPSKPTEFPSWRSLSLRLAPCLRSAECELHLCPSPPARPLQHNHPRSHMATLQLPASLEPVVGASEAPCRRW